MTTDENAPAATGAQGSINITRASEHNTPPGGTLLEKFHAILRASCDRRLTACDLAVLVQLCDYFSAARGAAWPSMETLAFNVGRSRRAVVSSVARLQACGHLVLVRRGDRRSSNRYMLAFREYIRPKRPADATVNPASHNSVQSAAACSEAQFTSSVKPASQDTNHEPGQEAEGECGIAGAIPAGLRLPSGATPAGESFFATQVFGRPIPRGSMSTEPNAKSTRPWRRAPSLRILLLARRLMPRGRGRKSGSSVARIATSCGPSISSPSAAGWTTGASSRHQSANSRPRLGRPPAGTRRRRRRIAPAGKPGARSW